MSIGSMNLLVAGCGSFRLGRCRLGGTCESQVPPNLHIKLLFRIYIYIYIWQSKLICVVITTKNTMSYETRDKRQVDRSVC